MYVLSESVPLPLPTSAVVVALVQMGAATESKTSEKKAVEAARIGGFVTSTKEQRWLRPSPPPPPRQDLYFYQPQRWRSVVVMVAVMPGLLLLLGSLYTKAGGVSLNAKLLLCCCFCTT